MSRFEVQRTPHGRARSKRSSRLKAQLESVFREHFPNDTVDVSDGYKGNVHVLVVSRRFDKLGERERQALLWGLMEGAGLTEAQKLKITLLMGVSPGEIK